MFDVIIAGMLFKLYISYFSVINKAYFYNFGTFLRLKQPFHLKDCVQAATTRRITHFKTLACIKHRIIMNQQMQRSNLCVQRAIPQPSSSTLP